jgi:methionyl-tRNA formyltransferase
MDEGVESNHVLSQVAVCIAPADDASRLYARVTGLAMRQIPNFVPRLADGSFRR